LLGKNQARLLNQGLSDAAYYTKASLALLPRLRHLLSPKKIPHAKKGIGLLYKGRSTPATEK